MLFTVLNVDSVFRFRDSFLAHARVFVVKQLNPVVWEGSYFGDPISYLRPVALENKTNTD